MEVIGFSSVMVATVTLIFYRCPRWKKAPTTHHDGRFKSECWW